MTLKSFLPLVLPSKPAFKHQYGSLTGSSFSLFLSTLVSSHPGLSMVVVDESLTAEKLALELNFFLERDLEKIPVFTFPDWETLPYDTFSPHQDIVSERLTALYQLMSCTKGVLIVPVATLMHRVCPKEYLLQNALCLKKGQTFDLNTARRRLIESGYHLVAEVREQGEYAVRGAILDLFPTGSHVPFRIELFDTEIDSIRTFDVETQRSIDKIDEIELLPAREFPFTEAAISKFRTQFRDRFEGDPTQCSLYLAVSEGILSPGIEYYLPLFFDNTSQLFQYLPENTLIIEAEAIESFALDFWQEVNTRYDQYGHDRLRPLLPPTLFFLPYSKAMLFVND